MLCSRAETGAILAKVGALEIKSEEVRVVLSVLDSAQKAAIAKDPTELSQYIRSLLVQRLILSEAVDQKLDQDPAVIAKLVSARESTLSEIFLQKKSEPEDHYPTDSDLIHYYDSNKESLIVPRSLKLAQIFIAKDKAKLESIEKKLKSNASEFSLLAISSSEESTSAAQGGEIGWLTEDQIQPEIREKLLKLAPGAISAPIQLKDGWHIMKIMDVREAKVPVMAEIKDKLVAKMRADRSRVKRQEYLTELLKTHPIALNEIEISQLLSNP